MSQNDIVGKINKLLNTSKVKVTGNFPIQILGEYPLKSRKLLGKILASSH